MNCRISSTASWPLLAFVVLNLSHKKAKETAGNAMRASLTPMANGTIGKKKPPPRTAAQPPSLTLLGH